MLSKNSILMAKKRLNNTIDDEQEFRTALKGLKKDKSSKPLLKHGTIKMMKRDFSSFRYYFVF